MGHHIHLTLHEREGIMIMRRDGKSVSEIARAIRRDKSTVSREPSRNSCARSYRASTAQRRYDERRKACRRRAALDGGRVFDLVREKFLEQQRSPEQIGGRLAPEMGRSPVSDTAIYRGIHAGRFDGRLGGRKAKRRLGHRDERRRGPMSSTAGSRSRARSPSGRGQPGSATSLGIGRGTRSPAGWAAAPSSPATT